MPNENNIDEHVQQLLEALQKWFDDGQDYNLRQKIAESYRSIGLSEDVISSAFAQIYKENAKSNVVKYSSTKLEECCYEYERILMSSAAPLYWSDGRVIVEEVETPIPIWHTGANGRKYQQTTPVKQIGIRRLIPISMDDVIGQHVETRKWNGKQWVPQGVPSKVSATILNRKNPGYKTLRGILSCPSIRPDGSIIDTPGFDKQTGYYRSSDIMLSAGFRESLAKAETDSEYAMAVATACLRHLRRLFVEFPFYDPETGVTREIDKTASLDDLTDTTRYPVTISESATIAELLTTIARSAFEVVPAFAQSAPNYGEGKTYAAELIVFLHSGKWPAKLFWSSSKEENDKMLATCLNNGFQNNVIDNVNGTLASVLLAQAIDSKRPMVRLLGKNELTEREQWCVFHLNGVNISPTEDLGRRLIYSNLNSGVENPKNRNFRFNPRAMIENDRIGFIQSALFILSAYSAHGLGKGVVDVGKIASFQDWADMICGALMWLGCPNPLVTQKRVEQLDPGKQAELDLLAGLRESFGTNNAFNANDIRHAAIQNMMSTLAQALVHYSRDGKELPSAKSIGRHFLRLTDKVIGGLVLRARHDSHDKKWSYFIEDKIED
ncbi:hypothetical protein [Neoaquamicrobium sediminum]|uniref:hypothetical protein n=1 Tax=Neoaquamicrobium sediminum TaxID=1849104 RepID=UPI0040365C30